MATKQLKQQNTRGVRPQVDKMQTSIKKDTSRQKEFWTPRDKIVVSLVIFGGLVVVALFLVNLNQRLVGQRTIETYLEDKYKRDFIVNLPERKANGFGVEGYLESEVSQKDRGDLKFQARSSSGGTSDNYPAALWREEETPLLESKLQDVFGYLPYYELEIYSMNTFNDRVSGENIPTIAEVSALYPGELPYTLRITSNQPFSDATKNEAAEKLYRVIQYIQSKKASATLQYTYQDPGTKINSGWSLDSIELSESDKVGDVSALINQFETSRR